MSQNEYSVKSDQEALAGCIAAIVESLRALGYKDPHYAKLRNENGEVILAKDPGDKTYFAIQVRTWKPVEDVK